jgi:hypothetical protein
VFGRKDGATVIVNARRLSHAVDPGYIAMPHMTRQRRSDGTLALRDDVGAHAARRNVVLIGKDGTVADVLVKAVNAPDFSGWPTTMPQRSPTGPVGVAPIRAVDIENIAFDVLALTRSSAR